MSDKGTPDGVEMHIEIAGGLVEMDVAGIGRPLVLLHSLLADRGSFARVVPPLSGEFRVIVPDLPGFGGSAPVGGGLAGVADRVAAALRALLGDTPPILLGNGFGGFVALTMAIRHPGLAARLVVADSGAAFSEAGRAAFRGMSSAVAANGLAAVTDTAMRRLFAPDFQAANPELMAERRAAFLRTDLGTFHMACQALAELDIREAVRSLHVPTLVLVGEQDEATPPPMAHELAALLPQASLTVLPGCAHVPQLQDPERFLAAIHPFITGAAHQTDQDAALTQ
jgi:3-oxoadipate enol-lactonase